MDVITYPWPYPAYAMLVKGADDMRLEYITIKSDTDLMETWKLIFAHFVLNKIWYFK